MFTEILYAKKDPVSAANRISPERKKWVRKESAMILAKNLTQREKAKVDMVRQREESERILAATREERTKTWLSKTKNSPFAVDLVAEDERIYEENQVRIREAEYRRKTIEERRQNVKNQIILKALAEFSDLDTLRREKRAIIEEETRLKALLALERTAANVSAKADRLVAERAAKQRRTAKSMSRREIYKDSLDQIISEESVALRKKHGLSLDPKNTEFRIF
jgi:hypothetical protein